MTRYPELTPLKVGDRVGLISTSGPSPAGAFDAAVALLSSWGLVVVPGDNVLARHPRASYLAGSDQQRSDDLTAAWMDDSLSAVFCIRGGYGVVRILDLLDAELLRTARPKALIGSSDLTGLHEYWEHELGLASWFAPMVGTDDLLKDDANLRGLHAALFAPVSGRVLDDADAVTLVPGRAEGRLTGGNLSLLAMTSGAHPAGRQRAAGKIVLLEDVTEDIYRLDGLLHTLLRSDYFEGAVGIALGTWQDCGTLPEVRTLAEELLVPLGVPLIWGLRFGHGPNVASLPLGVNAVIVADEKPRIEIV